MKLLLASLFMAFMSQAYGACEEFPIKNGPIVLKTHVQGLDIQIHAVFEKRTNPAYGNPSKIETSHAYRKPRFFVNNKQVHVNRGSAQAIFQSLNYDHLEYAVQSHVSRNNSMKLLDEKFSLVATNSNTVVVDPEGYIMAYHKECADWTY